MKKSLLVDKILIKRGWFEAWFPRKERETSAERKGPTESVLFQHLPTFRFSNRLGRLKKLPSSILPASYPEEERKNYNINHWHASCSHALYQSDLFQFCESYSLCIYLNDWIIKIKWSSLIYMMHDHIGSSSVGYNLSYKKLLPYHWSILYLCTYFCFWFNCFSIPCIVCINYCFPHQARKEFQPPLTAVHAWRWWRAPGYPSSKGLAKNLPTDFLIFIELPSPTTLELNFLGPRLLVNKSAHVMQCLLYLVTHTCLQFQSTADRVPWGLLFLL